MEIHMYNMTPTKKALKEGIYEEIPGVDFVEEDEDELTFTVMWGGVDEEGYRTTYGGIERFTQKYNVGVELVSGNSEHSTWKVVEDGDPFSFDVIDDIYDV